MKNVGLFGSALVLISALPFSVAMAQNNSNWKQHGFCTFGNWPYHLEYKTAVIAYDGPYSEWIASRDSYAVEFEKVIRANVDLDASYKHSSAACNWYSSDREQIEGVLNDTLQRDRAYGTDWVPGRKSIALRYVPK